MKRLVLAVLVSGLSLAATKQASAAPRAFMSRYFYSNGVECGLSYYYCDGSESHSGCYSSTYTEYIWFACP